MPSWENFCHQTTETVNGMTCARPCPCSQCNECPKATLDCKMGKQYCVWDSYKQRAIPTPFRFDLLDKVHYLHIPQVYTRCSVCMFRLKHEMYNITEIKPFKQEIEDLPF